MRSSEELGLGRYGFNVQQRTMVGGVSQTKQALVQQLRTTVNTPKNQDKFRTDDKEDEDEDADGVEDMEQVESEDEDADGVEDMEQVETEDGRNKAMEQLQITSPRRYPTRKRALSNQNGSAASNKRPRTKPKPSRSNAAAAEQLRAALQKAHGPANDERGKRAPSHQKKRSENQQSGKAHEPSPTRFKPLPKERHTPEIGLPIYDFIMRTVNEVHLKCHHKDQADFLEKVAMSVHPSIRNDLLEAKGLGVLDSDILKVYTVKEFCQATTKEVLEVWRLKNILVVDVEKLERGSPENFDAEAFAKRCPAIETQTLEVHDYSQVSKGTSYDSRMLHVTIPELIECATSSPEKHRIVNALDIPNTEDSSGMPVVVKMALQDMAWRVSMNRRAPHLCWHLAATAGAHTHWHLDSDGLCTAVHGDAGEKLWSIGRYKSETGLHPGNRRLCSIFNTHKLNDDIIDATHIPLRYGMTLFMRPLTPHRVITTKHSLFRGEQFLATPTLRETCWGILHGFTAGTTITNVSHAEIVHDWLRGIAKAILLTHPYPPKNQPLGNHRAVMPDITDMDDMVSVIHVCSILFLGSAVFPEAYRHHKPLSHDIRERLMQGRDLAIRLGHRLYYNVDVYLGGEKLDFWKDFFYAFVARQAAAVFNNLKEKVAMPEVQGTTATRFMSKITILAGEYPDFGVAVERAWGSNKEVPIDWFGWPEHFFKCGYVVADANAYTHDTPDELIYGSSKNEWYPESLYSL
ncbi:hypothetical protein NP233_g3573 [Leucocoprinus birnbaumii]|uniref:Uncharacterized protein n=1 Tax=Leucocoprinus birnbaumii TaxID=56174 RepID=A0AAD5YTS0_9AGAR|nr:hypothetical protein NP233_g3573 [Leucocoprinus birnbaumii]